MAGMRRPVLTLLLLASLTFFVGLGRQAITDGDEAYYAEAAREMVEGGDWLTPHFNYEYRWEKPVLYYWLTSTVYLVTGPTEAAARFWSALSGVGLVLLTWAIARDTGADARAAWLAGAIAATCFGYFAEARLALPDLPLTFCITLTIWAALRQRWAVAGITAGLGFLMKGPVALVVPAVVILPIWWRDRATVRVPWRGIALAAILFLVVGLPWYAAMAVVHGRAYLESFFVGDNFERFATSRFAGRTSVGWWFYGPILLGGLVPWTAYAVTFLIARLFGTREGRRWSFTANEWRLLLWGVLPLLFFTVSLGKQPRYILPVLPPFAILLAQAMSRRIAASRGSSNRSLLIATALTAAMFALTGVLLLRARPLFITSYAALTTLGIALLFSWSAALAGIAVSRSWRRLPIVMTLAAASLLLSLQFGALAGMRPEPVEQIARLVRAYRVGDEPVGECGVFVRNLVFYAGFKQQKDVCPDNETTAIPFLQSPNRVFLIARSDDAARIQQSGAPARVVGQVQYIDTANVKLRTLLWPDPDTDVDTIVLLTNR